MIGALDLFTRTVKKYYEKYGNMLEAGKQGIDTFLFAQDDLDTVANFTLDKLVVNPQAVSFRKRGEQAHVRPYEPGVGTVYPASYIAEKTTITEEMLDSVVAGIESTSGFSAHETKIISDIMKHHTIGHLVTRWKNAIDVIRTGKFTPLGIGGVDIGEEIDFSRDASLDITYDFTAAGATIGEALFDLYTAYVGMNGNPDGICIICGTDWIKKFQTDADVLDYMKANTANVLVEQSINPPSFVNVQGLYQVAKYLIPGTLTPVYILGYKPRYKFLRTEGGTEEEFMPTDEAVIFSMNDNIARTRVFRGVNALSDGGKRIRTVGEIVFDGFTEKDPVSDVLRSQTRYSFIANDINETGRSTGTFPTES